MIRTQQLLKMDFLSLRPWQSVRSGMLLRCVLKSSVCVRISLDRLLSRRVSVTLATHTHAPTATCVHTTDRSSLPHSLCGSSAADSGPDRRQRPSRRSCLVDWQSASLLQVSGWAGLSSFWLCTLNPPWPLNNLQHTHTVTWQPEKTLCFLVICRELIKTDFYCY